MYTFFCKQMITLTFPDGSEKDHNDSITGFDIASNISKSLAKSAIALEVNGTLIDLSTEITSNANIRIITKKDKEALEIIRHSTAHLLAEATQAVFPEAGVSIGPVIENGFYYDFDIDKPISEEDLVVIEKKMHEIASKKTNVVRKEVLRSEAIEYFESIGEKLKVEIIKTIPEADTLTLYSQGEFTDLCCGPHVPNTSYLKHFKLLKVSGAYFQGNSSNKMLQRIYGTAFESKEKLDNYLEVLKTAEQRDHRKIGKELDLFHISDRAVGSVFWHEKGYTVYNLIQEYIRKKLSLNGYFEVKTPMMMSKELWEKSGHWDKYQDNMFIIEDEKHTYALKPMNCPGHIEIFNQGVKSYRDLPLRMSEFGSCHRNESSGSLHGIMRVRNFTQDDAHIFCTEDQIESEVKNFCNLLMEVYKDFGFKDVGIKVSTRPKQRAGSDETWDKSETGLTSALSKAGYEFEILEGEGAFYGPKIEFQLTDALSRVWQCGTLQLDFVLPDRLSADYTDENGNKKQCVVLHRAIIGTFERFIGILLEHYAGALPLWIAPIQVVVCTITNRVDDYAEEIASFLKSKFPNLRINLDLSNNKINYKVRQHMNQKIPYLITIGDSEKGKKELSIRRFGSNKNEIFKLEDFDFDGEKV